VKARENKINNQTWGVAVSIAFHVLILIGFFLFSSYSSAYEPPIKLDFSIVYNLIPKGNSLDKKLLADYKPEKPKKKEVKKKLNTVSDKSASVEEEKKYGVRDGEEGVDPAYIKENLSGIKAKIGKQILYPPIARRMGWQGKVLITFLVDVDGNIIEVELKTSSGYAVLDNSALQIVKSLSGLPKPSFLTRVTVPINYTLN